MNIKVLLKKFRNREKISEQERNIFLEICAKISVCLIFDIDKDSIVNKFNLEEIEGILESTKDFQNVKLEELFHYVLFECKEIEGEELDSDSSDDLFLSQEES